MKRETVLTFITSLFFLLTFFVGRHFMRTNRITEEVLNVGFILNGDESIPYSNNFIRAQHAIAERFGNKIKVISRTNVSADQIAVALDELISEKCRLIFSTSYSYSIIVKEYAEKYPEIQFCQASGDNANEEPFLKNYHTAMGEIYQGRYVSGIVAGMKLKELIDSNLISKDEAKIGFIGAFPFSEIISGYTAFFLGVRSIVPTATMTVEYTYTWSSFSQETLCTEHLINEGCRIISQHTNTIAPAIACERNFGRNVFHVGYNQSMIDIAPMTSLISTRINWIPYISGAVEAVLENKNIEKSIKGTVHGNDISAGFNLNWVQLLDLNEVIACPGTKEKIAETIQAFKKGKVHVFTGNYIGVNPYDESDTIRLSKEFKENAKSSSPKFNYILKDVITVKENQLQWNLD